MILTLTMSPAVDMFAVTEQFFHDSKTRCQITRQLPGGGGINVARNLRRMGVSTTAVFPAGGYHGELLSRLLDDDGQKLRDVGHEYGATTGRPRRCGWFDGVAIKYAAWLNGFTELAVTKMDILDHFDEIKICTGYRVHGEIVSSMPDTPDLYDVDKVSST